MRARLFIIAALVLVAAGCGGGGSSGGPLSKSEYEHKMQAEAKQLTDALRNANVTSAKDVHEFADRLGSVKDDIAKSADNVQALQPPTNAAADTQTIADVLHRIAAAIGEIQTAASKNDDASFQRDVRQLAQELRAAGPAVKDLNQKGYDVGEFGS
jgi:methyl-accepting chemotaxis protein